MTLDHIDAYLFHRSLPFVYEICRMVFPVFVFVLAHNLAKPSAFERGVHARVMRRLAVFGILALASYTALHHEIGGHGWLPLNILFTLMLVTACVYFLECAYTRTDNTCRFVLGGKFGCYLVSISLFVFYGAWVEYGWWGVLTGITAWWYYKYPDCFRGLCVLLAIALLWVPNGNLWAVMSLPLLAVAPYANVKIPRLRWVFYAYYPAHLAILWGIVAVFR